MRGFELGVMDFTPSTPEVEVEHHDDWVVVKVFGEVVFEGHSFTIHALSRVMDALEITMTTAWVEKKA